ncbi:polysaccharide deacetylase family protein [Paenibacillus daejeonensis]|uniref:polysaccharide deacetylase family protein n=1 Tax=Paenibacillus daejeonensis TaxID=135193 RepID=UPI00035DA019|nr:polysaccharide deacetylase family protein [Paenibacillus daejeonensis]
MFKKGMLVTVAFCILAATLMFAFPDSALSHKGCMAWVMAKNKAFALTHPNTSKLAALDPSQVAFAGLDGAARVPVLMYHYIVPAELNTEPANNSIINLEAFEAGMNYLHEEGYYTATLEELEAYVAGEQSLPEKSVVITFDDGYENNIIYAYPIMKQYGFKAALFVVGSNIQEETGVFDPAKKSFLSHQQMNETRDVFEYHSHTYDLHFKKELHCGNEYGAGMNDKLLKPDIAQMKELGIDSPYFAYPYGEFRQQMVYYLRQSGYRMAFTVRQGFVRPGDNSMQLNRLTVTSSVPLSELLNPPE